MLQVRDLRSRILKPASFSLSAGEALAVRGPSGAGKTLLLRAVADLDPNEGLVTLDGRDRSIFAGPEWRRLVGSCQPNRAGGLIRSASTLASGQRPLPSSETWASPTRRRRGRSP